MRHGVDFQKFLDHLGPEGIACSSRTKRELVSFGVWIAPNQVCHGTLVGYLSEAVDDLDLIDGVYRGGETAVDAKDLIVDDDGEREEIKHVGKVVPYVRVAIFPGALCIETVRLRDTPGLVVAADQMYSVWVTKLEAHEQGDGLDGEKAAINVVAYDAENRQQRLRAQYDGRGGVPTHLKRGNWCRGKGHQS